MPWQKPPRLAEAVLRRLLPDDRADEILGDLAEEFWDQRRGEEASPLTHRLWYWRESLHIATRYLFRRSVRRHPRPRHARRTFTKGRPMTNLLRDLRHALRGLLHQPTYAAIVVATLALGIGANSAVFSLVDALVLRPFPIPNLDRLVMLFETAPQTNEYRDNVSPGNFLSWQEESTILQDLVAQEWWDVNLSGTGEPERLQGSLVTPGFLDLLGVEPRLGRTLAADGDSRGVKTAVISYQLFARRFGSDPSVVGSTILLNGERYDVVGVAQEGFDYPYGTEVWAPLWFDAEEASNRQSQYLTVIGRMASGHTAGDVQAELDLVAERLAKAYPDTNRGRGIHAMELARAVVDVGVPNFLTLWQATTIFVLLIACVNVANLLLARGADRQKELSLQQALGAGRGRIVRLLLTENLLLSGLGALLSLPLAWAAIELLRNGLPPNIQRFVVGWREIDLDMRVVGFTALVTMATAFVFGLVPALRASRLDLTAALKEGGRSSSPGRGQQRGRSVLVVAEVALALMLLVASGLSIRGTLRLTQADQGYDPDSLMTMQISLPEKDYADEERQRHFYRTLVAGIRELSGVESADVANVLPSSGSNNSRYVEIEGQPVENFSERPTAQYRVVSPDFLSTMRIPLGAGRAFNRGDRRDTAGVAVVSQSFADRAWPGQEAVGKRFRYGEDDSSWLTVVGVCGDVLHDWFLRTPGPTFYVPLEQASRRNMFVAIRTRPGRDPEAVTPAVRALVREADANLPIFATMTMRRLLFERTIGLRYASSIMAVLGAIALVLAAVGLYGVIAYSVSRRTHEIGVRVALGADRTAVLHLTIRQALGITGIGIAIGLILAYGAGRLMEGNLFGVVQLEASTFVLLAVVLAGASLMAGYVPARRALRVDPVVALRAE